MRLWGLVGSAGSEVFGWCFSCKGSVGSVVVVEVLEGLDHWGDFVDSHGEVGAGVELVAPGSVTALDGSIELWRPRREDVEGQVLVGAGLLELGHELGASVDLDGFDGIGHLHEDGVEELGGGFCGGPCAGPGDGPFGERIVGVEVLDGDAGQRIDRELAVREGHGAWWAAYSPGLKRIGIQNWRRASTVGAMSRQAFPEVDAPSPGARASYAVMKLRLLALVAAALPGNTIEHDSSSPESVVSLHR